MSRRPEPAEKLKKWLEANNYTGVDLARGIKPPATKQAIYLILNGKNKISASMAHKISAFSHGQLTVEELTTPPDQPQEAEMLIPESVSPPLDSTATRRISVEVDSTLARRVESLVCWLPGRRTMRSVVEAALEAHVQVYELIEVPLLHPVTHQVVIKKAGESFPDPVYAMPPRK
jgi:transcriptional regulator with XRE-family HTH domain